MNIQQLLRLSEMEFTAGGFSYDGTKSITIVNSLNVLDVSVCVRQYNKEQLNTIKQKIDNKLKIVYKEISDKTGLPFDEVQSDYSEYCRLGEEEKKYINWDKVPKTFDEITKLQKQHEISLRNLKKADYDLQMAENDRERKLALELSLALCEETSKYCGVTHPEQEKIWEKQFLIYQKYEHIGHICMLDNDFQIIENYELIKTEIEKCFPDNKKEIKTENLESIIQSKHADIIIELIKTEHHGIGGRNLRVLYNVLLDKNLIADNKKQFHTLAKREFEWYIKGYTTMANFQDYQYNEQHHELKSILTSKLEKLEQLEIQ